MARKKRLADNAEPTTIYLTPIEKLVLSVVEMRRGTRKEATAWGKAHFQEMLHDPR